MGQSIHAPISLARGNKFRYLIQKMPILTAMTQSVDIDPITLGEVEANNPLLDMRFHGEKLKYGNLDIGFLVDENYDVYTEIYNSMNAATAPNTVESSRFENWTDIAVLIYDNDSTKIVRKFIFTDCFCTNLGTIPFDVGASDNTLGTATFAFHSFRIEPTKIDTTNFTNGFPYDTENYPDDVFTKP